VDTIMIGSGQGGVPLAIGLSNACQNVALFNRGPLGGSCLNFGCTPSKMLLASAHAAAQARLRNSLILAGVTLFIAVPLAITLGMAAGLNNNTWIDSLISISALSVVGPLEFVTGLIQIITFDLNHLSASSSIRSGRWSLSTSYATPYYSPSPCWPSALAG
jgi:ABC-type dipeptide/oligopeptide/nickel transport system permease component